MTLLLNEEGSNCLYWLYPIGMMRALFCWACAGVHNMLIFGCKKWGHILALVEKRKHFGNSVQQLNLELGANWEELFSDPAVHALFKYKHFRCNITGGL